MNRIFRPMNLIMIIVLAVLSVLLYSYSDGEDPLTAAEVDAYITKISAQTEIPGGQHDMDALREFLQHDDGKEFYTVNFYKYHKTAKYVGQPGISISGEAAYDKFSSVMVNLLGQQASHPIFGSTWLDGASQDWDRMVIVRYRSRRDIAEIFANNEFAEASAHKWASIEKHERFLVQGLHIPALNIIITCAIVICILLMFILRSRRKQRDYFT